MEGAKEIAKTQGKKIDLAQYSPLSEIPMKEGFFATVTFYRNKTTGEDIAVKMMQDHHKNPILKQMFEREVSILQALHSDPRAKDVIVDFKGEGTEEGKPFYAMEALTPPHGWQELRDYCRGSSLSTNDGIRILSKIVQTMQVVDNEGIIDPDIKTDCFFIKKVGKDISVKRIDFHNAHFAAENSDERNERFRENQRNGFAQIAKDMQRAAGRNELFDEIVEKILKKESLGSLRIALENLEKRLTDKPILPTGSAGKTETDNILPAAGEANAVQPIVESLPETTKSLQEIAGVPTLTEDDLTKALSSNSLWLVAKEREIVLSTPDLRQSLFRIAATNKEPLTIDTFRLLFSMLNKGIDEARVKDALFNGPHMSEETWGAIYAKAIGDEELQSLLGPEKNNKELAKYFFIIKAELYGKGRSDISVLAASFDKLWELAPAEHKDDVRKLIQNKYLNLYMKSGENSKR